MRVLQLIARKIDKISASELAVWNTDCLDILDIFSEY